MKIIPMSLAKANEFIRLHHRHNKPVDHRGHRFSIGLLDDSNQLIGVGVAGQPIARKNDNGKTLEVLRVCVLEGYPNANSKLYGRLKRIAQLMGYEKVITYTLQSECASSLKAIGATIEKILNRESHWSRPARPRVEQNVSFAPKLRWKL